MPGARWAPGVVGRRVSRPRIPAPPARSRPASRFPLGLAPPEGEAGSVPGYEFEGRQPRAARATAPTRAGQSEEYRGAGHRPARPERPGREPASGEPRRFRYTSTVGQPMPGPPPAWPGAAGPPPAQPGAAGPAAAWSDSVGPAPRPGFEFDDRARQVGPPGPEVPRPGLRRDAGGRPAPANQQATARPELGAAAEWGTLLRSLLPQPARPTGPGSSWPGLSSAAG